ncbi:multicopper oxidase domain-containing protein [Erysipelothrix sp. HDW6C]|uniref:multicopper oxidase family protein n=1 Tax=Erysipelothrix sp. HDW6C TaxID=2714930 RepID=UPI00140E28A7|nr:multicopper oxidase domain-containing protein [Erysipelothrix sp. HDW6C]QIK68796.1 multicopper oxidase domain-containing protein [Erysipelothrix sp. HDW6C]
MKNNYFYNETNFDCLDAAYKPLLPIEQKSVPLRVPPLLRSEQHDNHVSHYTIVAQEGEIQILDGPKTKTWGYNGDILGPTIRFTCGETYTITLVNQLPEVTTFHWHGLNIPGPIEDGGPFAPVKPGESKTITFTVNQPASTCWLHPHPCPNTASQVWHGLAAMVIVSDAHEASLDLPRTYGVDDIPLILQDRSYHDNQLDYQRDYDADGIQGNVALINGGVNATFDVTQQRIRLRVLNGANRKEFRLHLDDDLPMTVISSDASLLPKPITLTHLMLTVAERSEFILDFSDYKLGDCVVLYSDDCPILTFRIKEFARNKQNSIQTNFSMAPLSTTHEFL